MKLDGLIAIDVHTHAEVSCRQPHDEVWQPYDLSLIHISEPTRPY